MYNNNLGTGLPGNQALSLQQQIALGMSQNSQNLGMPPQVGQVPPQLMTNQLNPAMNLASMLQLGAMASNQIQNLSMQGLQLPLSGPGLGNPWRQGGGMGGMLTAGGMILPQTQGLATGVDNLGGLGALGGMGGAAGLPGVGSLGGVGGMVGVGGDQNKAMRDTGGHPGRGRGLGETGGRGPEGKGGMGFGRGASGGGPNSQEGSHGGHGQPGLPGYVPPVSKPTTVNVSSPAILDAGPKVSVDMKERQCENCSRSFKGSVAWEAHLSSHRPCDEPGCTFEASAKAIKEHKAVVHGIGTGKGGVEIRRSPLTSSEKEEVDKYRAERRKNFPTAENVARKLEEERERRERGELNLIQKAAEERKRRLKEVLAQQRALGHYEASEELKDLLSVDDSLPQPAWAKKRSKPCEDAPEKVSEESAKAPRLSETLSTRPDAGPLAPGTTGQDSADPPLSPPAESTGATAKSVNKFRPCYAFRNSGRCRNGKRCRFLHIRHQTLQPTNLSISAGVTTVAEAQALMQTQSAEPPSDPTVSTPSTHPQDSMPVGDTPKEVSADMEVVEEGQVGSSAGMNSSDQQPVAPSVPEGNDQDHTAGDRGPNVGDPDAEPACLPATQSSVEGSEKKKALCKYFTFNHKKSCRLGEKCIFTHDQDARDNARKKHLEKYNLSGGGTTSGGGGGGGEAGKSGSSSALTGNTLLHKLLKQDIMREKSRLLQAFRFFVNNEFFHGPPEKPVVYFDWQKE